MVCQFHHGTVGQTAIYQEQMPGSHTFSWIATKPGTSLKSDPVSEDPTNAAVVTLSRDIIF